MHSKTYLFFGFLLCSLLGFAQAKLIVTTDIGQDPDDQQSLVRLLHYADQFQLAGIIANADVNYKHEAPDIRTDIVHELIEAYGQIEENLRIHSPSFPSAAYLHSLVKAGCSGNGKKIPVEDYVGQGKDTEGSDWIIRVVDRSLGEPVMISVWGGACDLAQALWKVRETRTEGEVEEFVGKLRVYFIGKQDSSNEWIMEHFPGMWLILAQAENGNSWESTYRGMFLGGDLSLTSKEWLHSHIIGKNPLASLYPDKAWTGHPDQNPHHAMKEGDSPAMLYFLENGLNVPEHPSWGGWGGRFEPAGAQLFRDAPDQLCDPATSATVASTLASVYRWRPDFQRDFAARVQWGAAGSYGEANHHPVVQLGDALISDKYLEIKAPGDEAIFLDAGPSFDPDGDSLLFEWFLYPEASALPSNHGIGLSCSSTSRLSISIPEELPGQEVHLILKIADDRAMPLTAYKRIIIRLNGFQ